MKLATATDLELVTSLKAGDSSALIEIMNRYSHKAHNLAMRITRSEEDAEEVLQDVFVTVYRKISSFEGKSAFSSWLYRITANCAFMKLRKKKQTPAISLEDMVHVEKKSIEDISDQNLHERDTQAVRAQMRALIQEAVQALPEEYRAIFVLRDIDGLSNQEVCDELGLSLATVKSRLHRSRMILRKRLRGYYEEMYGSVPAEQTCIEELTGEEMVLQ